MTNDSVARDPKPMSDATHWKEATAVQIRAPGGLWQTLAICNGPALANQIVSCLSQNDSDEFRTVPTA